MKKMYLWKTKMQFLVLSWIIFSVKETNAGAVVAGPKEVLPGRPM